MDDMALYFDRIYGTDPDPWRSDSWYEERKRDLLMAALPQRRYRRAVEPGCGVGALTRLLAARCDEVLAVERSARAAGRAQAATADLPHVRVDVGVVPQDWPGGPPADLVVLSEMGYYTDRAGWTALLDTAVAHLSPHGTLVAVHWRHPAPDHRLTGDETHDLLLARGDLAAVSSVVEEDFRLDVLLRAPAGTPGLSVAARTGVPGAVPDDGDAAGRAAVSRDDGAASDRTSGRA